MVRNENLDMELAESCIKRARKERDIKKLN